MRAYTDGAARPNPGRGAWAVIFTDPEPIRAFTGRSPSTTNNRMELTAVLEAVRRIPDGASLEIVTDSGLVVGWFTKGWKRKDMECAKLVREVEGEISRRGLAVCFLQVEGHGGNTWNNYADSLCAQAFEFPEEG